MGTASKVSEAANNSDTAAARVVVSRETIFAQPGSSGPWQNRRSRPSPFLGKSLTVKRKTDSPAMTIARLSLPGLLEGSHTVAAFGLAEKICPGVIQPSHAIVWKITWNVCDS
jgi:hypothetical protein